MLLHRKLTRAMIRCAFEVIYELGSGFWESLFEEKAMVELKTLKPLTKRSCLSCPSM